MDLCNTCGKKEDKELKRCGRCKLVLYCSVLCQKQDWKKHKPSCCQKTIVGENKKKPDTSVTSKALFGAQLISPELPNFSNEYVDQFPKDVTHIERLQNEELKHKSIKLQERANRIFEDEDVTDNLLKRWGRMDHELIAFITKKRKPGDIFESASDPTPFAIGAKNQHQKSSPKICKTPYQTIRNFVCADIVYEFGHTYVSFGFVDLFQLLMGMYRNTEDVFAKLRYLCFDKCPIIVARGHLIRKLLSMSDVPIQSILQVWFSSCWNKKTCNDFQKACSLVLADISNDADNNEICMFIKHWMSTTYSKEDAKHRWSQNLTGIDFVALSNFTTKKDRVKYSRYLLTGTIFIDESKIESGNVSMFSMPNDGKIYERLGENLFRSIDIYSTSFFNNQCDARMYGETFMESVQNIVTNKLEILRDFIQKKRMEVTFKQKDILAEDFIFAREIKEKDPYGIEWSNIPDYMNMKKFVKFARACSGDDTIHTVDVMNWPQKVFGACWLDYMQDKAWLNQSYFQAKDMFKKMSEGMWRELSENSTMLKFIKPNFLGFPTNVVDKLVGYQYVDDYVNRFFVQEDGVSLNKFVNKTKIIQFSPFSYSNASFHVAFTFNSDILLSNFEN